MPAAGKFHQCQGVGLVVKMRHDRPSKYPWKAPAPEFWLANDKKKGEGIIIKTSKTIELSS